ncbi:platelet glycoprotein VI-like isoform X2 [Macrotis lagotis]
MLKSEDGREAQFLISKMGPNTAGRYQCRYKSQSLWSETSDPLELIVTGSYEAPSLSALPSSQVAPGQEVTLQCQSQLENDRSALYKDGEEISYGEAQSNGRGAQANFFIPAVIHGHEGTYRCYSFHGNYPYEWSTPSDPLVLRVTGPGPLKDPHLPQSPQDAQALTSSPPSERSMTLSTDAAPLDYTLGNVVRLLLAGLVLIIMGILLIEACIAPRGA